MSSRAQSPRSAPDNAQRTVGKRVPRRFVVQLDGTIECRRIVRALTDIRFDIPFVRYSRNLC